MDSVSEIQILEEVHCISLSSYTFRKCTNTFFKPKSWVSDKTDWSLQRYLSDIPPTWRVWHKSFFKVGSGTGPWPRRVRHSQKCLRTRRNSPKKGRLRHKAINLTLRGGLKPGKTVPEARGTSSEETDPTRSAPLTSQPAEVCLINCILLIKISPGLFSNDMVTCPGEGETLNWIL